jgi:hypothetical protein
MILIKIKGEFMSRVDTRVLSILIQKKYIAMFGDQSASPEKLIQEATILAEHFSWNMPMAKRNLEVLTRQVWMRIKSSS